MIFYFFEIFEGVIIRGLFWAVIILILSKMIFKEIDLNLSINIIKVILLVSSSFSLYFLIYFLLQNEVEGIHLESNIFAQSFIPSKV